MNNNKRKVRALGLCSGGLDSTLAGVVLRDLGIDVEWVTFETPFFTAAKARKASQMTGIPLTEAALKNRRPGYAEYVQRTSTFFPRPPKKEAS